MNVEIHELKEHLSVFVRKAAVGGRIIVTDSGKPVAKLEGLGGRSMLERGIAEGWITPPSRGELSPPLHRKGLHSTMEVLDEDRG